MRVFIIRKLILYDRIKKFFCQENKLIIIARIIIKICWFFNRTKYNLGVIVGVCWLIWNIFICAQFMKRPLILIHSFCYWLYKCVNYRGKWI